ncbi:MAG: hypothetical protein M1517_04570 [Deltaproteobacteria bacterium]|nr:hypothetical protein [Deltaproteobacteria bacterium]
MPELPEVESRRMAIDSAFTGRHLVSFDIYKKNALKHSDAGVQKAVIGKVLEHTDRRGKYLILTFGPAETPQSQTAPAGGLDITLHFGLFGGMDIAGTDSSPASVCARLVFDDRKALFLLRWVNLWPGRGVQGLEKLGPDPVAEPDLFTPGYLAGALSGKKTAIKQLLMDQSIVAGIGAVYADEVLFQSGILPERPARLVSVQEIGMLHRAIVRTMRTAIEKTVASGKEDRPFLSLEGRQGCPVCKTPLSKTRLAGRRTIYCPSCQH